MPQIAYDLDRQVLINAVTGQVGTSRHLSGYPTYQELPLICSAPVEWGGLLLHADPI